MRSRTILLALAVLIEMHCFDLIGFIRLKTHKFLLYAKFNASSCQKKSSYHSDRLVSEFSVAAEIF